MPPYQRAKGDRNLWASVRLSGSLLGMLRRPDLAPLEEARDDARRWMATMPDLATSSTESLVEWVRTTYPPRIGASMHRLLLFSMLAGGPRAILDRLLERPGVAAGLANRIVGGTGEVDSAQLAVRLWALGRLVASDPDLTAAFDDGIPGLTERIDGTALEPELAAFLADHGHRGNDEYELATPCWSMDPTPVLAVIDRLRQAPPDRDPLVAGVRLRDDADAALLDAAAAVPAPMRPMVRRAAAGSRLGSIGRERAKDILVLENLAARLVLHELVRRAAERGGPTDPRAAFCVTIDELVEFVEHPEAYADAIAERAARRDFLDARIPPAWFEGEIPDPTTWVERRVATPLAPEPGQRLEGIAVSGGTASGPARVIADPRDPRGLLDGEVLVCAITDPSWTPLFLGAAAVVCDTGAIQSHAAIVARELGIPGVLSVPGITSVADGTVLHVDGTAGVVTVG
jgi:pyruvate,water dikinase